MVSAAKARGLLPVRLRNSPGISNRLRANLAIYVCIARASSDERNGRAGDKRGMIVGGEKEREREREGREERKKLTRDRRA